MADGGWMGGGWMGGLRFITGLVLILLIIGAIAIALLLRRQVVGNSEEKVRAAALRRVATHSGNPPGAFTRTAPSGEVDAFLIIPDISGYTQFMQLSHFSLAHAQYIISALLGSIIEAAEKCLATAKVEGDAVFLYALHGSGTDGSGLSGEQVGKTVVHILNAFYRKRIELMAHNTCPCVACRHVDQLDLKTVMHSGRLLLYDLRGQQELSGLPVIVAHRLLKNSLGLPRYLLITEVAHEQIVLSLNASPTRHVEAYEGIGEVAAYVYCYEPDTLLVDEGTPPRAGISIKAGEAARKFRENFRALTT